MRRPPWLMRLAVVGAYAAAIVPLAYPVVTGAFLATARSDQYKGAYAVREFGGAMLRRTGHIPLWNPYLYGGMPFVAAMDGDIYYPPSVLLRLLLRADLAVTWAFIIHVVLAGSFMYGFLRSTRLGRLAAFLGGLAYMMGGPLLSYVLPGHDGKLYVSALLPAALWVLVTGIRDGRRWSWPVLAVIVGCATLSPHVQILQYFLLCAGVYALHLSVGGVDAPRGWVRLRRLAAALVAVAVGLAMGAVQFLPVFQYIPWSPRAPMASYDYATQFSMPPEQLIDGYLPQFIGVLNHYWGRLTSAFPSDYLGAVVLVLATVALVSATADRRRHVRFWGIVALAATIWAMGRYTPLFHLAYILVPGTKYFRVPAAIFILTAFAVAVLAAEGTEAALAGRSSWRTLVGWAVVAIAFATPLATTFAGLIATHIGSRWMPALAEANAADLRAGGLRSLAVVALALGVLAASKRWPIRRPVLAAILLALVWVDLWSVERMYWQFSAPAARLFAEDAAIRYVLDDIARTGHTARVLAWSVRTHGTTSDPELSGNTLMVHRVRNVLGYHGNELRFYDDLSYSETGAQPLFTPHLWRLLNVRFILTDIDSLARRAAGATIALGPVRDAAGSVVYLYRVPGENPVAWVAPESVPVAGHQGAGVLAPDFDIARTALVDTTGARGLDRRAMMGPLRTRDATRDTGRAATAATPDVRVLAYDPGHLRFHLSGPASPGSTLIVSENYYPGWEATVDGRPIEVRPTDYTLIGVPLPAGAQSVELTFRSAASLLGARISISALLAALLWGVAGMWRPRWSIARTEDCGGVERASDGALVPTASQ